MRFRHHRSGNHRIEPASPPPQYVSVYSDEGDTVIVQTTNYTAVTTNRILCVTALGAITITLPLAPASGAYVAIMSGQSASTNNVTVARNGQTIMGLAENMVISDNNVTAYLVFDGSTWSVG